MGCVSPVPCLSAVKTLCTLPKDPADEVESSEASGRRVARVGKPIVNRWESSGGCNSRTLRSLRRGRRH